MKKLVFVFTMLVVLGVCSQGRGDVLYYNVFGVARSVDAGAAEQAQGLERTMIYGFLVLDVNEAQGLVEASTLILLGRDAQNNRVYRRFDDVVEMILSGDGAAFVISAGDGAILILTGNMRDRRVGFPGWQTVFAANVLEGSIQLQWGALLDLNQTLVGSGFVTAMLNLERTGDAASAGKTVDDVVDEIIDRLESRGFVPVVEEEEPIPV